MNLNYSKYSMYSIDAIESGYGNVIAIIPIDPRYVLYNNINNFLPDISLWKLIAVDKFNVNIEQDTVVDTRNVGDAIENSTFMVPVMNFTVDFSMPILMPTIGYVDDAFAMLWNYCKNGYWGTPTEAATNFKTINNNLLQIFNPIEFKPFKPPYTAYIYDPIDNSSEEVEVLYYNLEDRHILVSHLSKQNYSENAVLIKFINTTSPISSPTFCIWSNTEGLLYNCIINRISLSITPTDYLKADINILCTRIIRNKQLYPFVNYQNVIKEYVKRHYNSYLLDGAIVKITQEPSNVYLFDMETVSEADIMQGLQTTNFNSSYLTNLSINIDNNLKTEHTLHSLRNDQHRMTENSYPFAIYSDGRKIHGQFDFITQMSPWGLIEKLSGISTLSGGGFNINFQGFKLHFPNVVWSPANSNIDNVNSPLKKSINWIMVAKNYIDMPELLLN